MSTTPASPKPTSPTSGPSEDTSDGFETVLVFSLPKAPPPEPDDPDDFAKNVARRALASLDRMTALADSTEQFIHENPNLKPKELSDLIVAAGNLRERHVLAAAKILGDFRDSLRKKKVTMDA